MADFEEFPIVADAQTVATVEPVQTAQPDPNGFDAFPAAETQQALLAPGSPDTVDPNQNQNPPEIATADGPQGTVQGNFLPINRNLDTGEISFDATAGVLGTIIDAVTLPKDVFEGKVDPLSQEGIERSFDLAATASPAPAAARAASAAPKTVPKLPSIEQLRGAATAAYKRAEDAGLVVSQGGFARAAKSMVSAVRERGFNRRIHPKVNAAIQEVADTLGKQPTLQELDTLRRIIKAASKSNEPDERRLAGVMIDRLDSFISQISAKDVVSGDAQAGALALTEARALWSNLRKSEVIEEIFEKAKDSSQANFSASGLESALRTQFKQLAGNKKRLRGFTDREVAAIRKVARGGKVDNVARFIGKMAPTGVVSGGFGIGATAVGGPAGALLPISGLAGRALATRLTKRNAELVRTLARGGEPSRSANASLSRARRLLETTLGRPVTPEQSLEAIAPGA